MGRKGKCLDQRARDFIVKQMRDNGVMSKDEIKDLVRPHFMFDYQTAKEQAINRYVNGLVSSLRDRQGTRTSFTLRGENLVVNVDTCKSLRNVKAVKEQLRKQLMGTAASFKKAKRRVSELEGQTSMFSGTPAEEPFYFGTTASGCP